MKEIVNIEKPGRINGKNSKHRSGSKRIPKRCSYQIYQICRENRSNAARKEKSVGTGTMDKRRTVILGFFSDLFLLGFKIESIFNLKQKHLKAVFHFLEEQGQAPSTIQNKISVMRTFCCWMGKNGMVDDSTHFVKNKTSVRRSMVVREDKSWVGNGVDVEAKIKEISKIDQSVGVWLELCLAFGLRASEAILLRPAAAHEGDFLIVREGTKGGRERVVPINNDNQRTLLIRAKELANGKTGFIGRRGITLKQKKNRFNYVLKKCGITLADLGVSAHGLRHQYMHENFKALVGIEPPVRGGDLSQVSKDDLHLASQKMVERAGHTRVSIGSSYYGSRRVRKNLNVSTELLNISES